MNQSKVWSVGLSLFALALAGRAQPILVYPQGVYPQGQAFASASLSNLRVRADSADNTEMILTADFSYGGLHGPSARLVPVITNKKQPSVSRWFGGNPVFVGAGHGTISFRVKFFNDEPGVPSELTTDHVKILMLTEGANSVISQGFFAHEIKWGSPASVAVPALTRPPPAPALSAAVVQAQAEGEEKARQEAKAKALAEERARKEAEARELAQEESAAKASEKARAEAEARRLAGEQAKAEAKAREAAGRKAAAEEQVRKEAAARELAVEKEKAVFTLATNAKSKIVNVDLLNRNFDRTEMVIAVQYQYRRDDGLQKLGVDITAADEPGASTLFSTTLFDLAGGTRGIALFPVKIDVLTAQSLKRPALLTDKVWVYLTDGNGKKIYICQANMALLWRIPAEMAASPPAAAPSSASPEK